MEKIKPSAAKWTTIVIEPEWITNGHIALRRLAFEKELSKFSFVGPGRYIRQGTHLVKMSDQTPDIPNSVIPRNQEKYRKVEIDDQLKLSSCRTKVVSGSLDNGKVLIGISYLPFMLKTEVFAHEDDPMAPVILKDQEEIVGVVMPLRK